MRLHQRLESRLLMTTDRLNSDLSQIHARAASADTTTPQTYRGSGSMSRTKPIALSENKDLFRTNSP
jgi:hypothetical protein